MAGRSRRRSLTPPTWPGATSGDFILMANAARKSGRACRPISTTARLTAEDEPKAVSFFALKEMGRSGIHSLCFRTAESQRDVAALEKLAFACRDGGSPVRVLSSRAARARAREYRSAPGRVDPSRRPQPSNGRRRRSFSRLRQSRARAGRRRPSSHRRPLALDWVSNDLFDAGALRSLPDAAERLSVAPTAARAAGERQVLDPRRIISYIRVHAVKCQTILQLNPWGSKTAFQPQIVFIFGKSIDN